jgi:hypothetical protein
MRCVRYVLVVAAFAAVLYGDDITIPLDDGSIVIRADFHKTTELTYKILYPDIPVYDLDYRIKNQTSSRWRIVRLRFYIGGFCDGTPKQWSVPVSVSPLPDGPYAETGIQAVSSSPKPITLGGKAAFKVAEELTDCSVAIIKAVLLAAESDKTTIVGTNTEPLDLSNQLKAIQAQRDAEAVEQAKRDAAEAARQKRLTSQRKKKQAEVDARWAKMKAEEEAKAADERRKLRVACAVIYQNTIDKKIRDLTVREDQQVRACQRLGLYPPQ